MERLDDLRRSNYESEGFTTFQDDGVVRIEHEADGFKNRVNGMRYGANNFQPPGGDLTKMRSSL